MYVLMSLGALAACGVFVARGAETETVLEEKILVASTACADEPDLRCIQWRLQHAGPDAKQSAKIKLGH